MTDEPDFNAEIERLVNYAAADGCVVTQVIVVDEKFYLYRGAYEDRRGPWKSSNFIRLNGNLYETTGYRYFKSTTTLRLLMFVKELIPGWANYRLWCRQEQRNPDYDNEKRVEIWNGALEAAAKKLADHGVEYGVREIVMSVCEKDERKSHIEEAKCKVFTINNDH